MPSLENLLRSPAAKKFEEREKAVRSRCADCGFYGICKGGCRYSAVSFGDGVIDPWCPGCKRIFAYAQETALLEIQSAENRAALLVASDEHPLFRRGLLISLTQTLYPSELADNARRILGAYALGKFKGAKEAAIWLNDEGICGNLERTEEALDEMRDRNGKGQKSRNNCYLHVTYRCGLRCAHCYANADDSDVKWA
jgi:uncharacterized protein